MNRGLIVMLLTGLMALVSAGCAVATTGHDMVGAGPAARGIGFLTLAMLVAIVEGRRRARQDAEVLPPLHR